MYIVLDLYDIIKYFKAGKLQNYVLANPMAQIIMVPFLFEKSRLTI